MNIHQIDNYAGFGPISGMELAGKLFEHASSFGVNYEYGNVLSILRQEDGSFLLTTDMDQIEAKSVIVATGTQNKLSGLPGEKEFNGRGVSYCATCDGNFFKGKDAAVIGYKDQAVQEAIYLAGLVNHLYFVHEKEIEAAESHMDTLKSFSNVSFHQATPLAIKGEKLVSGLLVKENGEEKEYPLSGVFPLFGERSSSEFLANTGVSLDRGFLICNENMETDVPGLYGAGDCVKKKLRQVVTAASDGAIAATSAVSYIHSLRKKEN